MNYYDSGRPQLVGELLVPNTFLGGDAVLLDGEEYVYSGPSNRVKEGEPSGCDIIMFDSNMKCTLILDKSRVHELRIKERNGLIQYGIAHYRLAMGRVGHYILPESNEHCYRSDDMERVQSVISDGLGLHLERRETIILWYCHSMGYGYLRPKDHTDERLVRAGKLFIDRYSYVNNFFG